MSTRAAPTETTPHRGWTLGLASLGLFMAALDTLIVATALPVLRTSLNADLSDLEWTVNAYNLSFACLLLTGAAMGDRFGRRLMFSMGVLVFVASSAAAALAPNVEALIAARAGQGAGAAILMPISLTLISEAFPAAKRGAAIGLWGGIAGLAVASGPLVGGAVIEGISWEWIFWLNVPVGLLLIPLCLSKLTESFGSRTQLDIPGLVLAGVGLLSVTWGLVRTSAEGWASAEVLITLIGGSVLVVAFLLWERTTKKPMLELSLFRSRGFSGANQVSFFMYATLIGSIFLMTQFLQTGLGYSPLEAGVRILPWTAVAMIVSPIAGALADRFGNRPFLIVGMALQALGLGWLAMIAEPGMAYRDLALTLLVAGIGISLVYPTVANAVVGAVPSKEMGIASGTHSALREVGGVFGVAVLASVFAGDQVFGSPNEFVDNFSNALWVGAILSVVGIIGALLVPGMVKSAPAEPRPRSAEMVTEDA